MMSAEDQETCLENIRRALIVAEHQGNIWRNTRENIGRTLEQHHDKVMGTAVEC